ncbi:protein Yop1p [Trichomonascus vanleenenianus]|uniref:Yop1p n=1 Tax=Trichomonascus vanleenenianus TaxID=2268995 RepID=UPI003EC97880
MSAAAVQDKVFAFINTIDKELERYPTIKNLERQTGIPKSYSLIGFLGVYFLLIFLNVGGIGQLLANIATLVVPGYYSLIALETRGTADDTHYLTYWVVYAFFSVIEFWSKTILYWIPFYWLFKTVFFLYIGLPQFNGGRQVYTSVVRPFAVKVLGVTGGSSASLREKVEAAQANSEEPRDAASVATGVDL